MQIAQYADRKPDINSVVDNAWQYTALARIAFVNQVLYSWTNRSNSLDAKLRLDMRQKPFRNPATRVGNLALFICWPTTKKKRYGYFRPEIAVMKDESSNKSADQKTLS